MKMKRVSLLNGIRGPLALVPKLELGNEILKVSPAAHEPL
jgi:hypothetical protein